MGTSLGSFHRKGGADIPVGDGGTGASTAEAASANLGVGLRTLSVVVSTGELLALFTTPKELVPAPGAGNYIVVESITAFNAFGTAAYVANAAGFSIRYTDGSGDTIGSLSQGFVQLGANGVAHIGNPSLDGVSVAAQPNAAVVLFADVANPTTGDGSLKVNISYRVVTFP